MSEKDLPQLRTDSGASNKVDIASQYTPGDLVEISAAIAGRDYRNRNDRSLRLPDVVIWERQSHQSVLDVLRAYAAEQDRIKPFEPLTGTIPPTLRRYDPSSENRWNDVHETINRWKHPSFLDPPIGKALQFELPHAKPGYSFRLDPNTGVIEETKNSHTLDYSPERDGYNDGRPQYQVDPSTGDIVARGPWTADWRPVRDGWQQRDKYYGLNPETGQIELRPNVRTMKFRSE